MQPGSSAGSARRVMKGRCKESMAESSGPMTAKGSLAMPDGRAVAGVNRPSVKQPWSGYLQLLPARCLVCLLRAEGTVLGHLVRLQERPQNGGQVARRKL